MSIYLMSVIIFVHCPAPMDNQFVLPLNRNTENLLINQQNVPQIAVLHLLKYTANLYLSGCRTSYTDTQNEKCWERNYFKGCDFASASRRDLAQHRREKRHSKLARYVLHLFYLSFYHFHLPHYSYHAICRSIYLWPKKNEK